MVLTIRCHGSFKCFIRSLTPFEPEVCDVSLGTLHRSQLAASQPAWVDHEDGWSGNCCSPVLGYHFGVYDDEQLCSRFDRPATYIYTFLKHFTWTQIGNWFITLVHHILTMPVFVYEPSCNHIVIVSSSFIVRIVFVEVHVTVFCFCGELIKWGVIPICGPIRSIGGELHIESRENFMENLEMSRILQQKKKFLHIEALHLDVVWELIYCVGRPPLILTMHDMNYTLT